MATDTYSLPYWRLSGFYFSNCAVLGAILPYWGFYLRELGLSAADIGFMGAVLMATNIVAPNVWGALADYTARRLSVIRVGTFLAGLSFCGVFFTDTFIGLAFLIGCCSFCWQGLNSQFEVVTLGHLHGQTQRYGHIRLWGSMGFIFSVSCLGWLFDYISIRYLPYFVFCFLVCMWLVTLSVAENTAASPSRERRRGVRRILKTPAVWGLLLSVALLQLSHSAYYTFYSLYLDTLGYSSGTIGGLWSLAVAAEVGMFIFLYRLLPRLGLHPVLLFGLAMAVVRWASLSLLAQSLVLLALVQLLHAFTFSAVHSVVVDLIRRYFGGGYQGRGQALYSSLCVGGGAATGAALSGHLWEWSPAGTYGCAAVVAALALLIAWVFVYPPERDS